MMNKHWPAGLWILLFSCSAFAVEQTTKENPLKLIGLRGNPKLQDINHVKEQGKPFLPMIDQFGQFKHKTWPGKIHSLADLQANRKAELIELKQKPGVKNWTQYGGWKTGPKLKSTGFFRAQKHDGKWWLVDPTGRLFWSHGIDCVGWSNATTPVTDREHYFENLPNDNSPLKKLYGHASWAPHGYYQGKGRYRTFNFTAANLHRKYGPTWHEQFLDLTHYRLRSWGMNTIGNWSSREIYLKRKTAYVATIHFSSRTIEGSSGYWGKFYDPFSPDFRNNLRKRLEGERGKSAGDPWCIGYFVQNEISWGKDLSLSIATLASPADQPSKIIFVQYLKTRYRTIGQLNKAWGVNLKSWQALLDKPLKVDPKKAHDDLASFETKIHEQYFRICKEEVKRIAPKQMYMGCRFAWVNDRAVIASSKYCDLVSYNIYKNSIAKFKLPANIDLPVIIGEFHFGALDRGMFHTGLRATKDQNDRADHYRNYVRGGLTNPQIVGTHWFQFGDQATTGRGDGENYQIGFLDVCDTPYPETIKASRDMGYHLYEIRSKSK